MSEQPVDLVARMRKEADKLRFYSNDNFGIILKGAAMIECLALENARMRAAAQEVIRQNDDYRDSNPCAEDDPLTDAVEALKAALRAASLEVE